MTLFRGSEMHGVMSDVFFEQQWVGLFRPDVKHRDPIFLYRSRFFIVEIGTDTGRNNGKLYQS
jgi:hypothetical protein